MSMFNILYDRIEQGIPLQNLSKKTASRLYYDLKLFGIEFNFIDINTYEEDKITLYPLEIDHILSLDVYDLFNKQSLEFVRNKNIPILIYWPSEGFGLIKNNYWLEFLQFSLGKLRLENNKKFLIYGNLKIAEEFDSFDFSIEHKSDIYDSQLRNLAISEEFDIIKSIGKIHRCFAFEICQSWYRNYFINQLAQKDTVNIVKDFDSVFRYKRKKVDYICYNRLAKPHRIALINELYKNGVQQNGYISFIQPFSSLEKQDYIKYLTKQFLDDESEKFFDSFIENFDSLKINYGDISLNNENFVPFQVHVNHFIESWFSLVSETEYDTDTLTCSEKVYKPIANAHSFIIWGSPGILKYLRDQGYQTFPELFDESYDSETNHTVRLKMIVSQVERFCNLDVKRKKKLVNSIKDKLSYNRKLFLEKCTGRDRLKDILESIILEIKS